MATARPAVRSAWLSSKLSRAPARSPAASCTSPSLFRLTDTSRCAAAEVGLAAASRARISRPPRSSCAPPPRPRPPPALAQLVEAHRQSRCAAAELGLAAASRRRTRRLSSKLLRAPARSPAASCTSPSFSRLTDTSRCAAAHLGLAAASRRGSWRLSSNLLRAPPRPRPPPAHRPACAGSLTCRAARPRTSDWPPPAAGQSRDSPRTSCAPPPGPRPPLHVPQLVETDRHVALRGRTRRIGRRQPPPGSERLLEALARPGQVPGRLQHVPSLSRLTDTSRCAAAEVGFAAASRCRSWTLLEALARARQVPGRHLHVTQLAQTHATHLAALPREVGLAAARRRQSAGSPRSSCAPPPSPRPPQHVAQPCSGSPTHRAALPRRSGWPPPAAPSCSSPRSSCARPPSPRPPPARRPAFPDSPTHPAARPRRSDWPPPAAENLEAPSKLLRAPAKSPAAASTSPSLFRLTDIRAAARGGRVGRRQAPSNLRLSSKLLRAPARSRPPSAPRPACSGSGHVALRPAEVGLAAARRRAIWQALLETLARARQVPGRHCTAPSFPGSPTHRAARPRRSGWPPPGERRSDGSPRSSCARREVAGRHLHLAQLVRATLFSRSSVAAALPCQRRLPLAPCHRTRHRAARGRPSSRSRPDPAPPLARGLR